MTVLKRILLGFTLTLMMMSCFLDEAVAQSSSAEQHRFLHRESTLDATAPIVQALVAPTGFSESVVFSGLTHPTAVRFSPDGRIFVAEKSGLIKVFANLSATSPTIFHDLRTNVHNF